MALDSETRSIDYAGNGSTTVFAVPFKFLANEDLEVFSVVDGVESALTLGVDYTLTGAGVDAGGNLTMAVAPTSDVTLRISRTVDFTQPVAFRTQGTFSAATHERAFDRLTMQSQQLNASVTDNYAEFLERVATLDAADDSNYAALLSEVGGLRAELAANPDAAVLDARTVVATGAVTARTLKDRFAERILANDYGADPTGVADSTDAIVRALEVANSVPEGTWETGGDDFSAYVTRDRKRVVLLPGTYKLSRKLKIRWRGVQIDCELAVGPTEPSEGRRVIFYADHSDAGIEIDTTYNCYGFFGRGFDIRRRNAYIGAHHGIHVKGPNYMFGLHLEGVRCRSNLNGVHIVCEDATDGSHSMADLLLRKCQIAANAGWGVRVIGHAAIGGLFDNSIVQNSVGGVSIGVKGFTIEGNDFEGQERPLEVTEGTASDGLEIGVNYFEGNPVTNTLGLIRLSRVSGFRVGRQHARALDGGVVTVPAVVASNCSNGTIEDNAQLTNCFNVYAADRLVIPTAGASAQELCFGFPEGSRLSPQSGALVDPTDERGGGTDHFRCHGRIVSAVAVTAAYRTLVNGFGTINNNDYVFFACSIQYGSEIPHGDVTFLLIGTTGGVADVRKTWSAGSVNLATDVVKVGDTLSFVIGWKNTSGNNNTSCGLYVYPYASDTTVGSGARVSQILYWKSTTDPTISPFSPLKIVSGVGSDAPASGTWKTNDEVLVTATAGGYRKKVCTASGTPGTWKGCDLVEA